MSSGVIGVDFSGASAAGDALWVTEATQTEAGVRIDDCYRATDRWGRDRESAHAGLVERIAAEDVRTAGLDFPFSLPQPLLDVRCGGDWRGFLSWIGSDDGPADPAAFSDQCRDTADATVGKRDVRRETNVAAIEDCSVGVGEHRETYLASHDALDSLAAAVSAARVDSGARPTPVGTREEGCIYV